MSNINYRLIAAAVFKAADLPRTHQPGYITNSVALCLADDLVAEEARTREPDATLTDGRNGPAPANKPEPSPPPLGYCPLCGAEGVIAERRIDGDTRCRNGHKYPSKDAMAARATAPPAPPPPPKKPDSPAQIIWRESGLRVADVESSPVQIVERTYTCPKEVAAELARLREVAGELVAYKKLHDAYHSTLLTGVEKENLFRSHGWDGTTPRNAASLEFFIEGKLEDVIAKARAMGIGGGA